MMDFMTIVKKLKAVYGRAFNNNKWPVALQAVEWQADGTGLLERQRFSRQLSLQLRYIAGMTRQQCSCFMMDDGVGKLNPELEHPPPPAHA